MKLYWASSKKFSDDEILDLVVYLANKKYWYSYDVGNRTLRIEDADISSSKIINKFPAANDDECHSFVKIIWTARGIKYI
jgi:hypothetical protein